jgi:Na+/proline symporter
MESDMTVLYIFGYLVIGGLSVKLMDRIIREKSPSELAVTCFMFWPLFGILGGFVFVIWLFVPDIFKRETITQPLYCPPPPSPPFPPIL